MGVKNQTIRRLSSLAALCLLLYGCVRQYPDNFKAGDFSCEACKMSIVDRRFKTEVISPKGRIFRFDSIECLLEWKEKNREKIGSAWVTDFDHPEKWIPLQEARFLKSKTLPSPMGAFLSAYATEPGLKKAMKNFGGEPMSLKALETAFQK